MYASPFDEALSRPMLDPPEKKKFSWTSTVATVFTIDELDENSSYESYEAPTDTTMLMQDGLLEVEELNDNSEQAPLVTIDLEQAVLHERHKNLKEITSSLQMVESINKDLANVVDSQGTDIKRMSWLAIEAFDEAENGLNHVVNSSHYMNSMETWISRRVNQRNKGIVGILLTFLLMAAYAIHKLTDSDPQDYNGDPQKFP